MAIVGFRLAARKGDEKKIGFEIRVYLTGTHLLIIKGKIYIDNEALGVLRV